MEILNDRVCGLDVHKKSITACILKPSFKETRTFGTMTDELFELVYWIKEHECTLVAMESTGVYWKPIYNLLEVEEVEAIVVNAQHMKNVPGRKTDVKDAQWIAQLLQHGLLKASFIPNRDQRELRELVRYRRSLVEEISRESNRIQKVLEGANIKLGSVASNVLGVSGRRILNSLIKGETNPELLADLSLGKLKSKRELLQRSLNGLVGSHQRVLLSKQLKHIEYLETLVKELDSEVENRLNPFKNDLELLQTIPGIGKRTAEHIVAEIGIDMSRFPDANQLASWAGMAPGQNESAGKRKKEHTKKGNKYLRSALAESAKVCARTNTYLGNQYKRLAARRGSNKATIAVGHSILIIVYHILVKKEPYNELGSDYLVQRRFEAEKKRALRRLENLGFTVDLQPKSA